MRTSTLIDPGDSRAAPGTPPWAKAMRMMISARLKDWNSTAESVQSAIDLFTRYEGYKALGFRTFTQFCRTPEPRGLGVDPRIIDRIRKEERQKTIADIFEEVEAAGDVGRPSAIGAIAGIAGENYTKGIINPVGSPNSRASIIARLKRDHPEIAADLARGVYRSARAAGLAAGIIKPPDPLKELRRWWKKASEQQRSAFLDEVHSKQ